MCSIAAQTERGGGEREEGAGGGGGERESGRERKRGNDVLDMIWICVVMKTENDVIVFMFSISCITTVVIHERHSISCFAVIQTYLSVCAHVYHYRIHNAHTHYTYM
jgi:hypothetical protein